MLKDEFTEEEMEAPPISELLVEYLKDKFSINVLLYESNKMEGLEQLGFIKGVQFILQNIEGLQQGQRMKVME